MTGPDRLAGLGDGPGDPRPPADAATVIVARDTDEGIAVLMTRRNSATAFGGMWVFPGGKVDPSDHSPHAPDDLLLASRAAAVREAKEEADLDLVADALVPYSHWTPPVEAARRFLTWFFVGPAPGGVAGEVTIDDGEITDHAWLAPHRALERHAAVDIELAPPTFVTLHHLAEFATVAELLDHASTNEPKRYRTVLARGNGFRALLWEGDVAHDTGDLRADGPRHRVEMSVDGWKLLVDHP